MHRRREQSRQSWPPRSWSRVTVASSVKIFRTLSNSRTPTTKPGTIIHKTSITPPFGRGAVHFTPAVQVSLARRTPSGQGALLGKRSESA